jgi:putative membrane protein
MRYVQYLLLGLIGLVLIVVAFANRQPVTLQLLPADMAQFWQAGRSVTLPLFLVVYAAVALGLALGFVWEWLREHKHRAEASTHKRTASALSREVDRLKTARGEAGDEVLALLEKPGAKR